MNSMIKAENLKYEYIKTFENEAGSHTEKIMALNDISVSIEKGSFVAVLGHNGSGKSTFAKLINAFASPSGGKMWVNGYDTQNKEFIWDIRKSAGMVFQNPETHDDSGQWANRFKRSYRNHYGEDISFPRWDDIKGRYGLS